LEVNTKLIIWFVAAGLVAYGAANEGVRLYGKYALATSTATATVFETEEEAGDSDTGGSGVYYTGVYRFLVNGKTYYGRTDNYDAGETLLVRYNPANPDQNRDPTESLLKELFLPVVFTAIIYGFYHWLKWIRASEKTLPCKNHPDRLTKKRFYHWAENKGFHYVVDHGPRCEECINQLRELHRLDGSTERLYKPLPEPFSIP
jgi:hypothetical protein